MARLNITVPSELYNRIEKWRDRLNLSRICQEAIAREIAKLEDIPGEVRELQEVLARLEREKAAMERRWFRQGVQDGLNWGKGADYAALKRWGTAPISPETIREAVAGVAKDSAGKYTEDPSWDAIPYGEGWLTGVAQLWARVKDRLY